MSPFASVPLYADLQNAEASGKPGTHRWVPTRASEDSLVMLEMIVIKWLEKQQEIPVPKSTPSARKLPTNNTQRKLVPVEMISILKNCF
jgi:hypothetical protein